MSRSDLPLLQANLVGLRCDVRALPPRLDKPAGLVSLEFQRELRQGRQHDARRLLVDDVDDAVDVPLRDQFESLQTDTRADFRHTGRSAGRVPIDTDVEGCESQRPRSRSSFRVQPLRGRWWCRAVTRVRAGRTRSPTCAAGGGGLRRRLPAPWGQPERVGHGAAAVAAALAGSTRAGLATVQSAMARISSTPAAARHRRHFGRREGLRRLDARRGQDRDSPAAEPSADRPAANPSFLVRVMEPQHARTATCQVGRTSRARVSGLAAGASADTETLANR